MEEPAIRHFSPWNPTAEPGDSERMRERLRFPRGTLKHKGGSHNCFVLRLFGPPRVLCGSLPLRDRPWGLTCSQMAPVIVTGNGLTFPRPRFSRFRWLLKSFSSLFSSSSRELQYRTCEQETCRTPRSTPSSVLPSSSVSRYRATLETR